jgi:tellurium resistance protein TerD
VLNNTTRDWYFVKGAAGPRILTGLVSLFNLKEIYMLSLQKGQKLNLAKEFGLTVASIGLGWNAKKFDSQNDFDLDASLFVLKEDGSPFGRVLTLPTANDGWVCFYGQPSLPGGVVVHSGDNRTGDGEGDDETIKVDFTKMPTEASRVAVIVTIHEGASRRQNFGQVDEAYAKLYDASGKLLAEYDLDEGASTATAMMFVEFKKNSSGEWVMQAVGEGFNKGLVDFFAAYKVPGY